MKSSYNRDNTIDIARGIAIVLVVIGHSGISPYYWNIIYFFHMPLFFFISGCFTKPIDRLTPVSLIKKLRWKELYGNFVIYSTLFLVFSPILYQLGISNTPVESIKDFFERLIIILRFRTSTIDLLNTFWFIPVLFFAHSLSLFTISIFKEKNKIFILMISIIFYAIGRFCFVHGYKEPYDFSRILYFTGFFLLGNYVYPLLYNFRSNIYVLTVTIAFIINLSFIPALAFEKITLYYLVAISGIFITIFVSTKLYGNVAKLLGYIGKHTLSIFIFHTIVMQITELCLSLTGLTVFQKGWAGANPVSIYWWLYSIMGVFIPLGFVSLKKYLSHKLSRKNENTVYIET